MGVIFLAVISLVITDLVANPALTELNETRSAVSRWLRIIPFHKLKIPLVVFQVCHARVYRGGSHGIK